MSRCCVSPRGPCRADNNGLSAPGKKDTTEALGWPFRLLLSDVEKKETREKKAIGHVANPITMDPHTLL